jgi:hypothetical protein
MYKLGALIIAAMLADLITFALFVPTVGISAELNPVMNKGFVQYGVGIVVLLKIICTITILLLVGRIEQPSKRTLAAGLGIAFGLFGVLGNVSSMLYVGVP